eukprot:9490734-Pyramimonas_sp.AAC.1
MFIPGSLLQCEVRPVIYGCVTKAELISFLNEKWIPGFEAVPNDYRLAAKPGHFFVGQTSSHFTMVVDFIRYILTRPAEA